MAEPEITVAGLIERLAAFSPDLPVRISWDSGVCVAAPSVIVERVIEVNTGTSTLRCVVMACEDDDLPNAAETTEDKP